MNSVPKMSCTQHEIQIEWFIKAPTSYLSLRLPHTRLAVGLTPTYGDSTASPNYFGMIGGIAGYGNCDNADATFNESYVPIVFKKSLITL